MKAPKMHYLISAVAITVLILIIAFQNITTTASFVMLFSFKSIVLFFPIFFIAVLGIAAGSLYTLFIQSLLEKKDDSDIEEKF